MPPITRGIQQPKEKRQRTLNKICLMLVLILVFSFWFLNILEKNITRLICRIGPTVSRTIITLDTVLDYCSNISKMTVIDPILVGMAFSVKTHFATVTNQIIEQRLQFVLVYFIQRRHRGKEINKSRLRLEINKLGFPVHWKNTMGISWWWGAR